MEILRRYFRLYAYFVRFSFSRAMEFRFDFYLRIFMDCVYYAVNLMFFRLIFLHTSILGGWSESQVMIFVGGYLVLDAIQMTMISNNMWFLTQLVNKGDLDYYIVRPVSSLFFLSLRDFAANSFVNLLIAVGILAWTMISYEGPLEPARVLLFIVLLINGVFLHYAVRILFVLPVFWTHSSRGIDMVFWNLTKFMEQPDRIFSGVARVALTTLLPFALMASFPARVLFEDFDWTLVAHVFGVSVAFLALLLFVWSKALRTYSSASS